MDSKTPQFDALIKESHKTLVSHMRTCKWKGKHPNCQGEFEISSGDIEFLKMHMVPPPNYCPTCRRMMRGTHLNIVRLHKRQCNVPGHSESIISILPSESPFPVYDYKHYISDEFDAFSFGREYKEGVSPMEQLLDLRKVFPMPSFLNRDPSSINSEYSNGGKNSKNVYYAMAVFDSEDVWYCNLVRKSRDVAGSRLIHNSDQVYGSLDSDHIYKSAFVHFSKDCTDSMFLFDCRNCDSCFGCVNLRGKRYSVWNKQLTKEGYEAFMATVYPLTATKIAEYEKKMWELVRTLPMNGSRNIGAQNSQGVWLTNVKDVQDSNDMENAEHTRHCDGCIKHRDSMDVSFSGGRSHFLYSATNIGYLSSNVKFSVSSKGSTECEFIFNCNNLQNCFMCFGLRDKSYCILNKQYTPEEYFPLVDKIKTEMMKRGEYGDPISLKFSAQAYNFSVSQYSFPLTHKEIVTLGGFVAEEPESNSGDATLLSVKDVPAEIDKVPDGIINNAITCEVSGKPFRITASELQFHRKMRIPLPTVHPTVRIERLLEIAPMAKSYKAVCAKCSKSFDSLFDPEKDYLLYCESCFQQEVY